MPPRHSRPGGERVWAGAPPAFLGGGSLQPLLGSGARDDVVAVAEAEGCAGLPVLGPQRLEAPVQGLDVGDDLRVVGLGQQVPQLVAFLVHTLDVGVDLFDRSHVATQRSAPPTNSEAVLSRTRARPAGPRPARSSARARGGR